MQTINRIISNTNTIHSLSIHFKTIDEIQGPLIDRTRIALTKKKRKKKKKEKNTISLSKSRFREIKPITLPTFERTTTRKKKESEKPTQTRRKAKKKIKRKKNGEKKRNRWSSQIRFGGWGGRTKAWEIKNSKQHGVFYTFPLESDEKKYKINPIFFSFFFLVTNGPRKSIGQPQHGGRFFFFFLFFFEVNQ